MINQNRIVKAVYLKEISLSNIKCFGPQQTLSLSKDNKTCMWTIILGDNGTGKSTILRSIATALSQNEEDAHNLNLFEFARDKKLGGEIEIHLIDGNKKESLKRRAIDVLKGSMLKVKAPDLSNFNVPVFGYGSYRKLGSKGLSEEKRHFQSASLFNENISLINAEDWLLKADYESVKSKNLSKNNVEQVKSILLRLFRDEISSIEIRERGFGFGVSFQSKYGWVDLKNLSTGYRSLISWMVDLANWLILYYPKSEDPLLEQAIVLVDEIDLHLHVSLQKRLVDFLTSTFPKVQFIVTAHSPLIVQGSENENIIVLKKNGDHVLINDSSFEVKNWRIDQILTSDLFGLKTARSIDAEKKLIRRHELLTKDSLNQEEQNEMKELNKFIHRVPNGESMKDDEASKIIQNAAEILQKLKSNDSNSEIK